MQAERGIQTEAEVREALSLPEQFQELGRYSAIETIGDELIRLKRLPAPSRMKMAMKFLLLGYTIGREGTKLLVPGGEPDLRRSVRALFGKDAAW